MLNKIKNRKQEGFTIIEVLIVLAIAGLIMLIVFLAVPALQRNSRNTQREADASKVAAAVAACMNNRNGQTASCADQTALEQNGGLDMTKLQQVTSVGTGGAPNSLTQVNFQFGTGCKPDGSDVSGTGADRQGAVTYNIENTGGAVGPGRCIDV